MSKKKKSRKADKLKKQNINETVRMLEWARDSSGLWNALCNMEGKPIKMETFNALRNSIIENKLYYLLPILMSVHQDTEFVRNATGLTLLDSLLRDLKAGNSDSIVQACIEHTK